MGREDARIEPAVRQGLAWQQECGS